MGNIGHLLSAGPSSSRVGRSGSTGQRLNAAARDIDFRALAENSGDVICRIDADNLPVYVSPSAEQVLGWTPEEMILAGPTFIHPDDVALVTETNDRLASGEEETARVTFRLLRRDGSSLWVEANARLMRDKAGAPGDVVIVMRDVSERKRLEDELRKLSLTDGLTGLCNRRAFDAALDREWQRATRTGSPLSLLLLDIDHFKQFNDLYGHRAGDDCLRAVAAAVEDAARRPDDVPARYGGEEMAVILPNADAEGASAVAQGLRAAVEALRVAHTGGDSETRTVTVSIGVATVFPRGEGSTKMPDELLLAADGALYEAKRNGRNRVATTVLDACRHPANRPA